MRIPHRGISEIVAWLFLATVLAIGVPLFVCMPLWVDTTYHDLSARNLLWGGVHYRDIFETNLPGMVWIHALIRPIIGWSSEAIRIADLFVVGASILLLSFWLRRVGVPRSGRAWFLCAAFFFYVYETEFIHCQRDSWMLLPTVLAMYLRGRQIFTAGRSSRGSAFRRAVLEGMAWGCAVWIKPHSLVPALFLWLASFRRLMGTRRLATIDFLGLITGGAFVGSLGSLWLIATGTWPYMWDVLLNWNGEYYNWTWQEMDVRLSMVIMYFAPWSLIHFISLPLAITALIQARVWRIGAAVSLVKLDRALLAALYLGWMAEAVFLQKTFHYSQTPGHLLAFALVAAYRLPAAQIFIAWCLIGGTLTHYRETRGTFDETLGRFQAEKRFTYQQIVPAHKLINTDWPHVWKKCLLEGSNPEMKNHLSFYRYNHCAPTWTELDEVRQFLQTLNLHDRELVCWDDSTHPLYLDLKIRPGIRFMHVNTALDFRSKRPLIRQELIASGHKYVVSDNAVSRFLYDWYPLDAPENDPMGLPVALPCVCRDVYPWNQPIIFKAGRYYVHRVENPIGEIRMPYPLWINKP